ncbi:MAG: class I SAM-dependent methyltransferase [Desulfobacterium sp.]|nr:class I SAM-dependent methyltransferase [Desulfobacterium sp.]
MGYIFNFHDAASYDHWFNNRKNKLTSSIEIQLMIDMLRPLKRESVLDIGCGTGASLLPLIEMDLDTTGIDPSPYMLDIAYKKVKNRANLYRGVAEDLPFEDNSFNYACLFTSLEFVDDPRKALEEACRVAKDRIFIGVLNRYAIKGIKRRLKGIFTETIYNKARFFSIWEIKQLVRSTLGDVPVSWRTVCQLPSGNGKFAGRLEKSKLIQRFPFGAFVGIVIALVPRFRTRPLTLKYRSQSALNPLTEYVGSMRFGDSLPDNLPGLFYQNFQQAADLDFMSMIHLLSGNRPLSEILHIHETKDDKPPA